MIDVEREYYVKRIAELELKNTHLRFAYESANNDRNSRANERSRLYAELMNDHGLLLNVEPDENGKLIMKRDK